MLLYRGWESNPHSCEHEFESCASTNSATAAFWWLEIKINFYFLLLYLRHLGKVNFRNKNKFYFLLFYLRHLGMLVVSRK